MEFDLLGPGVFLDQLENRLRERGNAVVIVAEGAGAIHMEKKHKPQTRDKGGNLLQIDIGMFLKNEISHYFAEKEMECNLKYIDPSYMLRSMPADLKCVEELCFCRVV